MVNINDTVQFIKRRLGYPYVSLELSDEQITDIIQYEALMLFEKYVPGTGMVRIPKYSKKFRIAKNYYYVIDSKDREIFWVQEIYPEESEMLANGYPYTVPIVSIDSIPDLLLRTNESHIIQRYGRQLKWWQEEGTNRVWIFSDEGISGAYLCYYTCSHEKDLSSISREYAIDFNNICLGYTEIAIGNIRQKYGTIGSPVGDLQLNGESMISDGKELIQQEIEQLDKIKPIYTQIRIE